MDLLREVLAGVTIALPLTHSHLFHLTSYILYLPSILSQVATAGVAVTTLVLATAILRRTVLSVTRRFILRVLHLCVVVAGHALHLVTVAVVAGNLHSGVLQLVLQLAVGGEDDTTTRDE